MRTFYSLTKRQFLGMTKFNKFLYGNSKEKKVFAYTFFAIGLTAIILFFCWFRMVFQICMTFQYPQEIFKYLLKPFVVVSIFMTFLSALIKGSGILYLDKSIDLLFSYPIKTKTIVLSKLSYIYIWNVGISFLLLSVPLLCYDSLQKGKILFYVVDFLQVFLIPLVPTLLGVLLGNVLYRRLGNLFRVGSYSKSILYLVSFTVFFAFMIFFFRYVDFRGIIEIQRFCESQNIKLAGIFTDKLTGKNFDRPRYTVLVEDVLREGDTLIITELDRLGRNKQEILKQLQILKDKGVRVMVLELPTTLIDLSQMDNALARLMIETINNVLIEIYASLAQAEMEKKEKRQREGMEAKKLRGEWDEVGRPRAIEPEKFNQEFLRVIEKEVTPTQLQRELGLTASTFYRYRKDFFEKFPQFVQFQK